MMLSLNTAASKTKQKSQYFSLNRTVASRLAAWVANHNAECRSPCPLT